MSDLDPKEAEEVVIGQVLFAPDSIARAAQLLRPEHFFDGWWSEVYGACLDLWRAGTPVDIVTVTTELRRRGKISGDGVHRMAGAMAKVARTDHLEHHAMIVRDYHGLRTLRAAGQELTAKANVSADPDELIAAINAKVQEAAGVDMASDVNAGNRAYAMLNDSYRPPTHYLGIESLDGLVFMRPGNVITVSAPSGVGKTAFTLCCVLNLLERIKPWFVSLEMPADELITRMLCQLASVDIQDAMEGRLGDGERERLAKAANDYAHLLSRIDIDDSGSMSVDLFMARAEHKVRNEGCQLIVLDYAQLMDADRKTYPNEALQNEAISKGIRATARRLNVPILLVVHLNRAGEAHGSTQYEKDAHVRLKLDRQTGQPTMSIDVIKNRNGRTGQVETPCDMRYGIIGRSGPPYWVGSKPEPKAFSPRLPVMASRPDAFIEPVRDDAPF